MNTQLIVRVTTLFLFPLCSISDCYRLLNYSILLIRKDNLQVVVEGQVAGPTKDNDYLDAKFGHLNAPPWLLR